VHPRFFFQVNIAAVVMKRSGVAKKQLFILGDRIRIDVSKRGVSKEEKVINIRF
jgi:hypothetical protein